MKLTSSLLSALEARKKVAEEARIPGLLKVVSPDEAKAKEEAELKAEEFKKLIEELKAESDDLRKRTDAFNVKHENLAQQIKDKLGHNFYWDLRRGLVRSNNWRDPLSESNRELSYLVHGAVVDLQIACLGLKGEGIKAEVDKFMAVPLAEKAVEQAIAHMKSEEY